MNSISYIDFYYKTGIKFGSNILEIIRLHKIKFFTVRHTDLRAAGIECGNKIRKIGWQLDKTTCVFNNENNVFCIVCDLDEEELISLIKMPT